MYGSLGVCHSLKYQSFHYSSPSHANNYVHNPMSHPREASFMCQGVKSPDTSIIHSHTICQITLTCIILKEFDHFGYYQEREDSNLFAYVFHNIKVPRKYLCDKYPSQVFKKCVQCTYVTPCKTVTPLSKAMFFKVKAYHKVN